MRPRSERRFWPVMLIGPIRSPELEERRSAYSKERYICCLFLLSVASLFTIQPPGITRSKPCFLSIGYISLQPHPHSNLATAHSVFFLRCANSLERTQTDLVRAIGW